MSAASDFRVSTTVFDHPKVLGLIRATGPVGVACLIRLWAWASRHAPDGDLSEVSPEDIEMVAGWKEWGDKRPWFKELVRLGLIDQHIDSVRLRNWVKRQPWVAGAPSRSKAARVGGKVRAGTGKRDSRGRFVASTTPSATPSGGHRSGDKRWASDCPASEESLARNSAEKSSESPANPAADHRALLSLVPAPLPSPSPSPEEDPPYPPVENSATEASTNGIPAPRTPASGGSDFFSPNGKTETRDTDPDIDEEEPDKKARRKTTAEGLARLREMGLRIRRGELTGPAKRLFDEAHSMSVTEGISLQDAITEIQRQRKEASG